MFSSERYVIEKGTFSPFNFKHPLEEGVSRVELSSVQCDI